MVSITSLLLPILLAAVLVFIMSSLVWMVFPHHKNDFAKIPNEERVLELLRGIAPGQYGFPYAGSQEEMKTPEMRERMERGPVGAMVVSTPPNMARSMSLWFVYCLFVSVVVAYVTGQGADVGASYKSVFQVASTVAWASYGLATLSECIWFGRPWSHGLKQQVDALLYGLLTGGAFAGLWPS